MKLLAPSDLPIGPTCMFDLMQKQTFLTIVLILWNSLSHYACIYHCRVSLKPSNSAMCFQYKVVRPRVCVYCSFFNSAALAFDVKARSQEWVVHCAPVSEDRAQDLLSAFWHENWSFLDYRELASFRFFRFFLFFTRDHPEDSAHGEMVARRSNTKHWLSEIPDKPPVPFESFQYCLAV